MGKYFQWCRRTESFVFEQFGAPFPAWGLIILVTRCPELSAILNYARHDSNSLVPPLFEGFTDQSHIQANKSHIQANQSHIQANQSHIQANQSHIQANLCAIQANQSQI